MLVTLTSDFGYRDPFVGIMKAVILGINPLANIIDITHGITPHSVKEAALTISESYKYFPPKTIHVVVVDPEVGSPRRPIIVEAGTHFFVGPDNGVFSYIYQAGLDVLEVIHITAEHYFLYVKGPTFHGRDIFAPVAGWLSKGIPIRNMGDSITDYTTIAVPSSSFEGHVINGEVLFMDHFGNAITNISQVDINTLLSVSPASSLDITVGNLSAPLKDYYAQAEGDTVASVINSSGFIEVFVFKGSASGLIGIKEGDKVKVALKS